MTVVTFSAVAWSCCSHTHGFCIPVSSSPPCTNDASEKPTTSLHLKEDTLRQGQHHLPESPETPRPFACEVLSSSMSLAISFLAIGYCTMSYFHMTGLATQPRVIFLNPKVTARYSSIPHSIDWGLAGCRAGLKGPKRFHSCLVPPFCLPVNVFL